MSSFKLKVEVERGITAERAFEDAVLLANKLDVIIEFLFNGIVCYAYPNTEWEYGVEQYVAIRNNPGPDKIAFTKNWGV